MAVQQACMNSLTGTNTPIYTITHTHTYQTDFFKGEGTFPNEGTIWGTIWDIPSLCHQKKKSRIKRTRIQRNAAYSEAIFRPQLIHHFGYSKVAAYSGANLCSEEFT